jgi:hypothetical protein
MQRRIPFTKEVREATQEELSYFASLVVENPLCEYLLEREIEAFTDGAEVGYYIANPLYYHNNLEAKELMLNGYIITSYSKEGALLRLYDLDVKVIKAFLSPILGIPHSPLLDEALSLWISPRVDKNNYSNFFLVRIPKPIVR